MMNIIALLVYVVSTVIMGCSESKLTDCPVVLNRLNAGQQIKLIKDSADNTYAVILYCSPNGVIYAKSDRCLSEATDSVQISKLFENCGVSSSGGAYVNLPVGKGQGRPIVGQPIVAQPTKVASPPQQAPDRIPAAVEQTHLAARQNDQPAVEQTQPYNAPATQEPVVSEQPSAEVVTEESTTSTTKQPSIIVTETHPSTSNPPSITVTEAHPEEQEAERQGTMSQSIRSDTAMTTSTTIGDMNSISSENQCDSLNTDESDETPILDHILCFNV